MRVTSYYPNWEGLIYFFLTWGKKLRGLPGIEPITTDQVSFLCTIDHLARATS